MSRESQFEVLDKDKDKAEGASASEEKESQDKLLPRRLLSAKPVAKSFISTAA